MASRKWFAAFFLLRFRLVVGRCIIYNFLTIFALGGISFMGELN